MLSIIEFRRYTGIICENQRRLARCRRDKAAKGSLRATNMFERWVNEIEAFSTADLMAELCQRVARRLKRQSVIEGARATFAALLVKAKRTLEGEVPVLEGQALNQMSLQDAAVPLTSWQVAMAGAGAALAVVAWALILAAL